MAGEWETALYWQDRLVRLHKALFLDASPSPTKFAMAHLGLCEADARLPITPCSEAVAGDPGGHARGGSGLMTKPIAENRRARYDYFIEETFEAGMMLTGTEVKSLRVGRANIAESYASVEGRRSS
jgi:hypothetical protein